VGMKTKEKNSTLEMRCNDNYRLDAIESYHEGSFIFISSVVGKPGS